MPTVPQLHALVESFDWEGYHDDLKGEFADVFGHIVDLQGEAGAQRAGLDSFDNEDPFVQDTLTEYVGDRIVSLDDSTKADVSASIRNVIENDGAGSSGELGDLIADLVREKFDGYADWRADMIARSETSIAYNFGNIFGYKQAGVETVEVLDGDSDEECAAANGQTWTLDEALANPLAHPNCERDFAPSDASPTEEEE